MTWFDERYDAGSDKTNGDKLLEQLTQLNKNMERMIPAQVQAMKQLSLSIERHINLGR